MGPVMQHSGFIELLPRGDPQLPTLEIYLSSGTGKCAGYFKEARKRNQSTNLQEASSCALLLLELLLAPGMVSRRSESTRARSHHVLGVGPPDLKPGLRALCKMMLGLGWDLGTEQGGCWGCPEPAEMRSSEGERRGAEPSSHRAAGGPAGEPVPAQITRNLPARCGSTALT